jgi:uncharacterized protein YndB with AHSA1/START domain
MDTMLKAMDAKPVAVTVKRSFAAPAERVFDAWLDPAMVGRWMFDPSLRGEEVLRIVTEPHVDGRFSFLVLRGGKQVNYIGQYLELDRPHRLVFTWAVVPDSPDPCVASRVVIDIVPRGKRCDLTLVHELRAEWAHYAPIAAENWTKELGLLDRSLSPG